jgi:hypothetical protein
MEKWVYIYIYMWFVSLFVFVWEQQGDNKTPVKKMNIAIIGSFLWPILIPAKILFRILR